MRKNRTGYILQIKKNNKIVNFYGQLWKAKLALTKKRNPNEYKILAISEYQNPVYGKQVCYYIEFDGNNFIKKSAKVF